MSPTSNCPNCGRPSPAGVKFCAGCGSNLSSTSNRKGWKLFFGALAVLVGVVWATVVITRTQPAAQLAGASQPQALLNQNTSPVTAQAAPSPSLTLTSAQHLSEAKRALADGYKPNKDPQKAQWGEVATAKWHLKAIATTAPEYSEAQDLLKDVARRERQIELARKKAKPDEDSEEAAAADDDESDEPSSTSSSSAYSSPSATPATRQVPPASTAGGGSSDEYYTNSDGVRVHRPVVSPNGPPEGATAQCRDGSYSFSLHRSGTCSHHGGVTKWL